MNWRKFFAEKPLPRSVPPLTAWDELPPVAAAPVLEGDELMAFREKILPGARVLGEAKPRVEILKKGEEPDRAMGRLGAAGHGPVMALTGAEMRPWTVDEAVPRASAGMKAAVAVRKVEREVAHLPEETVGRLLGLERMKVRELEGRLIEMESRARLAEEKFAAVSKALEAMQELCTQKDEAYDFAHKCTAATERELRSKNMACEVWRQQMIGYENVIKLVSAEASCIKNENQRLRALLGENPARPGRVKGRGREIWRGEVGMGGIGNLLTSNAERPTSNVE